MKEQFLNFVSRCLLPGRDYVTMNHRPHHGSDFIHVVGLGEKSRFRWQGIRINLAMSGGDHNPDWGPPVAHGSGEFQAIHAAWHVDVGEKNTYCRVGFEDFNS